MEVDQGGNSCRLRSGKRDGNELHGVSSACPDLGRARAVSETVLVFLTALREAPALPVKCDDGGAGKSAAFASGNFADATHP